nr:hypothetical protein [Tanacetum cinerariifolium]
MIPEPGDAERNVNTILLGIPEDIYADVDSCETTQEIWLRTDDELTKKELKQIEADDQSIQTILLGLPEDIYAAIDSCKTAQEIWLRV